LRDAIVFCRVKSWLTGCRIVSLPFSDHCQPLLEGEESFQPFFSALKVEFEREKWKYVEIRPRLYLNTMRDNVLPARPYRFFECLWNELQPLGLMRLWVAERGCGSDRGIIAGLIVLMAGRPFTPSLVVVAKIFGCIPTTCCSFMPCMTLGEGVTAPTTSVRVLKTMDSWLTTRKNGDRRR
jgi:hypothetical protein